MQGVKIENNIVTEIISSVKIDLPYITLPDDHELIVGDRLESFDNNYYRITKEEAIEKGIIPEDYENKVIEWKNGWTLIDDFSTVPMWEKETSKEINLNTGESPDLDKVTLKKRPNLFCSFDPNLDEWIFDKGLCRENMVYEMKAYREQVFSKGVFYSGKYIQSDPTSRLNLSNMIQNADYLTFPFPWRTWDNTDLKLNTLEELQTLGIAMTHFVQTVYGESWFYEKQFDEAQTYDEFTAIKNQFILNRPI